VQQNKGLSKNRFKTEISVKIIGNSVKFNVHKERQKINGPQRNVILLPRLDLEKNSGTLRWLIRQNMRLSTKCVRWKAIFFGPEGMIGKGASGKWMVFPGATSWRVLCQSKVGLVNAAATWKPRCYSAGQIQRIYAILRGCPRLLITDLNHEPLTKSTELKTLKWPSFFPSYNKERKNHGETWNKKGIYPWFTCDTTHMLLRPA